MSNVVKNQHYVPQFYLRRFAAADDKVWVYDKVTRKIFPSSASNIASQRYFYDLPEEIVHTPDDTQIIEKTFSEVEAKFAIEVESLLHALEIKRKGKGPFDRKLLHRAEKLPLAWFTVMQFFRTRSFRQEMIDLYERGAKAIIGRLMRHEHPDVDPDSYALKVKEELTPLLQAEYMLKPETIAQFGSILMNHIWLLGVNDTPKPLWTSDHPVVKRPHAKHSFLSHNGFASPGIEIAFPLSPRVILIMYERTYFREIAPFEGRALPLDEDEVTYYNHLQVIQSRRQVYSPSNDFALADEICLKHPEICDETRTNVRVE